MSKDVHETRKLVAERYAQFKRNYRTLQFRRASYENFALWATETFDDMPSDDPELLKRMVDAIRKTPNPVNLN